MTTRQQSFGSKSFIMLMMVMMVASVASAGQLISNGFEAPIFLAIRTTASKPFINRARTPASFPKRRRISNIVARCRPGGSTPSLVRSGIIVQILLYTNNGI